MSISTNGTLVDKDSVYFQGSIAQTQARKYTTIDNDNLTFLQYTAKEPKKQSYLDLTEFNKIIGKYSFPSNKQIYKQITDDARVIPYDEMMKNRMDEYFSGRMYKNLTRLYYNSPLFFESLFSKEGVMQQKHWKYTVYIYCLCLIEYIMKNHMTNDFKQLFKGANSFYEWALPKYSEQISYLIKGPLSKATSIQINFVEHYRSIMNPSNTEGTIIDFLQLASLQNVDGKISNLYNFMQTNPNAYNKLSDEARTYVLRLNSGNLNVKNDSLKNNTYVIDLRNSDFGDTDNILGKQFKLTDKIQTEFSTGSSRLSLYKLQRLFESYSRFRIVSLYIDQGLYITALTAQQCVYVHFDGISLFSRYVTLQNKENSLENSNNNLMVSGIFKENNGKYEFQSDTDVITYHSDGVRVTDAKIYLTDWENNPLQANLIATDIDLSNIYNCIININDNSVSDTNVNYTNTCYEFGYVNNGNIIKMDYDFIRFPDSIILEDRKSNSSVNTNMTYDYTVADIKFICYKFGEEITGVPGTYTFTIYNWKGDAVLPERIFNTAEPITAPESILIPISEKDGGYNYRLQCNIPENVIWDIHDYYWSLLAFDCNALQVLVSEFPPVNADGDDEQEKIDLQQYTEIPAGSMVFVLKNPSTNIAKVKTVDLFQLDNITDGKYSVKYSNNQLYLVNAKTTENQDNKTNIILFSDVYSGYKITVVSDKGYCYNNNPTIDLYGEEPPLFIRSCDIGEKYYLNTYNDEEQNSDEQILLLGWCVRIIPRLSDIPLLFDPVRAPFFRNLNLNWCFSDYGKTHVLYRIGKIIRIINNYRSNSPYLTIDNKSIFTCDANSLYDIYDLTNNYIISSAYIINWNNKLILKTDSFLGLDNSHKYQIMRHGYSGVRMILEFS